MQPRFREDKATQAAALLLNWSGGPMNFVKLVNLLYLGDREALLEWSRPVTFAHPVSTRDGPVLSEVLGLINARHRPGEPSVWADVISAPENGEVRLVGVCPPEDLSDLEEGVLRRVFDTYATMDHPALIERLRKELPEWTPSAAPTPIQYREILLGSGRTEAETAETVAEMEGLALMDRLPPTT